MAKYEHEGFYELEIVDHAFGESKGGHPKIDFECKVIQKIHSYNTPEQHFIPAESSQYNTQLSMVFATDSQREMNVKKLRFAGWDGTSFDDFDMTGSRIIGQNKHVPGEGKHAGKVFDNFDFVLPPRERTELENKPGMKKKLNALLSKQLKENPPSGAAPKRQEQKPADNEPDPADESLHADSAMAESRANADDETPF